MFAPPVAKPKAKTASNDKSVLHRAAPLGQRHGDAGPAQMLRRLPQGNVSHADGATGQDSGPARASANARPPGLSWDFSKIPVFSPGREKPFQTLPVFPAPRLPIQAKLKVGVVNDPLEHEADQFAEQVMRMPAPEAAATSAPPQVSRKCDACEEEEKLQRKEARTEPAAGEAPASVHEVVHSPGQPLDPATRSYFEPRFGHDFSQVRVHADASAEQSARDVNAHAYTVGHNIVFGAAQFAPTTHEGRRLLAHELTHVVQQSGSDGIRVDRNNQNRGLSILQLSPLPSARSVIQRKPSGARCTGVTIRLPDSITFDGTQGPINLFVSMIQPLEPGTYTVSAKGGELVLGAGKGTIFQVSGKGPRAEQALFEAYLQSLSTKSVTLTVIGAGTGGGSGGPGGGGSQQPTSQSERREGKTAAGEKQTGQEEGVSEGKGGQKQEEPKHTGGKGEAQKGGEKTSTEYADKLKAFLDGLEAKTLDAQTERQLKSILDKMSLEDIALFKKFAIKTTGGDMENVLRSLRLFVSTKEVYEKQKPPESQPADESQKILADALKQYRDDMSQDEKEALARATVWKLSKEQLSNLTPAQIAESIVRVDKQVKGMGGEMAGGVNDAIKGTGWERVAGAARGLKGAASFWAFLSFAAVILASFVPGLNVLVLTASALAATMVAYAAANLQQAAEIKAAGTAKTPEEFQKHSVAGASAQTEVIIMTIAMALPIAGKFIGKLPLPAGLKNVSTALQIARNTLKQASGKAFDSAKASVLEALSKATGDLQPYTAQFRQNVAAIVQRLRGAAGSDFLKEIKATPELGDVVSPEMAKALQGLNPTELELAKKGIIEALDTAPAVAEETLKNLQTEMKALERDVQATTSAPQLENVLAKGTSAAEPEHLVPAAGEQAVEQVVQSRVGKLTDLSVPGVKQDLLGSIGDVQKLPNTNPKRAPVLKELQELLKKTGELEQKQKQGKVDVSRDLEEIDRRHGELDDLVADAVAEANKSRSPAVTPPPKKGAPQPPSSGKQPPQLTEGREYNKAHAFDYKYRELYIRDPKGGPPFQLDGYEPGKWIVSRKNQQLSEISLSEAKGHIAEFAEKYAKGRLIEQVKSSGVQTGGMPATGGQKLPGTLQGQYVLEVPIQSKPVPVEILVDAKKAGVIIRDVAGNIYELRPSPTPP